MVQLGLGQKASKAGINYLLEGEEKKLEDGIKYLTARGVKVEAVEGDVVSS